MSTYAEYLKSREWRAKREWALERAGNRCQVCNSGEQLDVHHRTYENVGAELPGDLTVLCRRCHTLYHEAGVLKGPPPGNGETAVLPGESTLLLMVGERSMHQWTILLLLVKDRTLVQRARAELPPEKFRDPAARTIYEALLANPETQALPEPADPVANARLRDLVASTESFRSPERVFDEVVGGGTATWTDLARKLRRIGRGEGSG